MQFISAFFSSFLSYFIIGHLVYIISGRNKKVALFIFGAFFIFGLVDWAPFLFAGAPIDFLIFYFLARVAPSIMAFLVFGRFTGGFGLTSPTKKMKRLLPQKPHDVFSTLKNDRKNAWLLLLGSLLVLSSFAWIEPGFLLYILLLSGLIGMILSSYLLINLAKIKTEKIILLIGKDKSYVYWCDINPSDYKLHIKYYFKNENYIVDPIGLVFIKYHQGQLEKHHLYWIATNDQVQMENEMFKELKRFEYRDQLELFKKYEYRQMSLEESRLGHITISKNQRIR